MQNERNGEDYENHFTWGKGELNVSPNVTIDSCPWFFRVSLQSSSHRLGRPCAEALPVTRLPLSLDPQPHLVLPVDRNRFRGEVPRYRSRRALSPEVVRPGRSRL